MSLKKNLLISTLVLCTSSAAIAATPPAPGPSSPTPVYDQSASSLLTKSNLELLLLNNSASSLSQMFMGTVPYLKDMMTTSLQNITSARLSALNSSKNQLNSIVSTQVSAANMPADAPNIGLAQLEMEKISAASLLNKNQLKSCSGTIAGTNLLKDCKNAPSVDPETYLLNFTNYITPSMNITTGQQDPSSLTPQQKTIMAPLFLKYAAETYASLDGGLQIDKLNDLNKDDKASITQTDDYKEMDTNKSTVISRTSIALANLAYVINNNTPPKSVSGNSQSLDSSLQKMAAVNLLPTPSGTPPNPLYNPTAKPVQVEKAMLATMGTIAYELYQLHKDNERIISNGALSSLQLGSADRMDLLAKTTKINQQIMQKSQAEKEKEKDKDKDKDK